MNGHTTRAAVVVAAVAALVAWPALLVARAAVAQPPAPLPDAKVQAMCAAEGGCVLVTKAWLRQEAERVARSAHEAAAARCRRTDV